MSWNNYGLEGLGLGFGIFKGFLIRFSDFNPLKMMKSSSLLKLYNITYNAE